MLLFGCYTVEILLLSAGDLEVKTLAGAQGLLGTRASGNDVGSACVRPLTTPQPSWVGMALAERDMARFSFNFWLSWLHVRDSRPSV